ncbi:reverse transcriptase [Senna tora]|uniref:Reverse transcriptase n=1 Tax=Senna tora TaxID=362788 RepID=A0A834SYW1_9FABA|nr:reverse transcriptase [Senna tora]
MNRLEGIQRRLALGPSIYLSDLQKQLWEEYENILTQEELLWMQKSREQWIIHGDRNTRFFHTSTMIRRKRNRIEALKNNQGEWVFEDETLKNMAVEYFTSLYTDDMTLQTPYYVDICFPSLDRNELLSCSKMISVEEVKEAIYSMRPFKSPGPDGLSPVFFQSQWKEGALWRLGNGTKVKFRSDPWLSNGKILGDYAIVPLSYVERNRVAADFVSASGDWALDMFDFLVPSNVTSMIAAIHPPSPSYPEDMVIWRHSQDGNFSTWSAYRAISRNVVDHPNSF